MVGNSGYTPPLGRGFGKISVMKRPHTHSETKAPM